MAATRGHWSHLVARYQPIEQVVVVTEQPDDSMTDRRGSPGLMFQWERPRSG